MEERKLKIMFNKDGRGAIGTKITLPISWVKKMGISPDNREVIVRFNEEKKQIIIENK